MAWPDVFLIFNQEFSCFSLFKSFEFIYQKFFKDIISCDSRTFFLQTEAVILLRFFLELFSDFEVNRVYYCNAAHATFFHNGQMATEPQSRI